MKKTLIFLTFTLSSFIFLFGQENTNSSFNIVAQEKSLEPLVMKADTDIESSIMGLISVEATPNEIKAIVPFPSESTKPAIKQTSFKQKKSKKVSSQILDKAEENVETLLAGEYAAYAVDTRTKTVTYIPPAFKIADECYAALAIAPKWLRSDLELKFRELHSSGLDKTYADLILKSARANTKYVDETCFLVAHIAKESLQNSRFLKNIDWLIEIPEFIYRVKDSLKYVQIVEHGDYNTGDYYTTTKYRIKNGANGATIWNEIPKEIYYWYIVHPKIHEEGLWTEDNIGDSQQRTYGLSWHNYYWNNSKLYDYTQVNLTSSYGTVSTIPRFGELMQKPEILWDREQKYYLFGRDFQNGDDALNSIGNWGSKAVPADPIVGEPRAIHPNQILMQHRGRCGEDAYLIAAACRTALIPYIHLGTIREDHVWGAVWDQGWNHFEFFRGGLAYSGWGWTNLMERGGYEALSPDYWVLSFIEGHRPDGYIDNHTADYTETCELRLGVMDNNNVPADGVNIRLYSSPGHNSEPSDQGIGMAGNLYTDYTGFQSFKAGDKKKLYFQLYHKKFGVLPAEDRVYVLMAAFSQPNNIYDIGYMKVQSLNMPAFSLLSNKNAPDTADFGVNLSWKSNEIISTQNISDSQKSTFHYLKEDIGNLSFFILDSANYSNFTKGLSFDAYEGAFYSNNTQSRFGLPGKGLWYVVFSNKLLQTNSQRINTSCELFENHSEIALVDIAIKGKDEVQKESFEAFECEIELSDGSKQNVTNKTEWDFVESQYAPSGSYFKDNVLYTGLVNIDTKVEIMASYNYNHLKPFIAKKTITIKNQANSVLEKKNEENIAQLNVGPNPFNGKILISVYLPSAQPTSIKIINIYGETVSEIAVNEQMSAGEHQFVVDCDNFSSGLYFCILESGNTVRASKLIKLR